MKGRIRDACELMPPWWGLDKPKRPASILLDDICKTVTQRVNIYGSGSEDQYMVYSYPPSYHI